MNLLDLIIVVIVVTAIWGGFRLGFLTRATSWVGLALGVFVAAKLLPDIIESQQDMLPANRLLLAFGILIGMAFVGQALGLVVGAAIHRTLPLGPIRQIDRVLGACAGFVGVIVALWFMLPAMADVSGWPAREARQSSLAHLIDSVLPRPPDTLQTLRRLVGDQNFPRVFDALRGAPDVGPPPAASGLNPDIVRRVSASTVKVEGIACRRIQDGSGFAAAPDVVVTNAHVVAGERETTVIRPDGKRLKAVVAVFDPNRDLAVLRVAGLNEPALALAPARPGTTGAVFGHPGGQTELVISPAAVKREIIAVGRDLYDRRETRRMVFVLAATLRPGDSGGGLVDQGGGIVGVAFAIAPDRPDTAYALTDDELKPVLALDHTGAADTGPCLSG